MNQIEIIDEFNEKKQNYKIVIGFTIVAILVLSIGASIKNIELPFIIIGVVLIAIFSNLLSFTYWTCPNCKKYLGSSLDIQNCNNCGVSFTIREELIEKTKNTSEKQNIQSYSKKSYQVSNIIPDYAKYRLYNLVEVYTRIDHKRNSEEIKLIEQQIRYKLHIDPLVDLSEKRIQNQFSEILKNDKPIIGQAKEDNEISKGLVRIQLSILFISVISIITYLSGYKNEIIMNLGFGLLSIVFLIEFINSFYTNEVNLGASSINYNKSPILFRIFQFFTISLAVMCSLALIKGL